MTLASRIASLTLVVSMCFSAYAKDEPAREVKADTLRYLQDMRTQNVNRLKEIDATLLKKIEDAQPAQIEKDVTTLKTAKREHLLRQEFLDRLIFQVDTKFAGGDLRAFLERSLTDMAKVDAVSSQVDTGLWKFLKFAADAVRKLPEQKENIISFLEGYMNRSVTNPIKPEDYLSSRNYTNGSASESGSPIDREDVGAFADRRLEELQNKN
jgi:hypothetical protein